MSTSVWAFEPLWTNRALPSASVLDSPDGAHASGCGIDMPRNPLRLQDAVERSLCFNPQTRAAWANVKIQASQVGLGRSAFLPTLSGSWQGTRDGVTNNVTGYPQLDSNYRTNSQNASVSLSWVLYDFGGRAAALRSATALMEAAQANRQETLQTVFLKVATDYYAAQAAHGALAAAREMEQITRNSTDVAVAQFDKGMTSVSDQLQAKTAYTDAVIARVKQESEWQIAVGTLAADMSLPPDTALTLPDVGDGVAADKDFRRSVSDLIKEAQHTHPDVLAAEGQVVAARARKDQVRAEGLPRVSFIAQYSYNNQPTSIQPYYPVFPTTHREWYLGIQVTIPIFEGFARTYLVREAEAQTELQTDTLDEVRQQVGLEVWASYQALQSTTSNLDNTATLLSLATHSYEAARKRYQMGVGNILELLNAQASLARAKRQRIQALTDWRSQRLQLAAKLGKLGMWSLEGVQ
ncbi:TolC family protein [Paraburkholderia susongensis]|uniref:Protein CyaE n=1 Tax=Paraburkholderia susongensis TaxID=1515439 RepID=A0A1X7M4U5_9BURK|nr:TolC family protein [Paraburkholderia susongensis]SMG61216.1 outer membrane protein [Paraburkholderia susongensis]